MSTGIDWKPTSTASVATWCMTALNGIIGDYLHERGNGLAVEMACYVAGKPLVMDRSRVALAYPHATPKLCLLVHGLGCNERLWSFADPQRPEQQIDYGSLLQAELGYTPFYVRYNSGLSVAENGQNLAQLLDALWACYPLAIEEIVCIGHSMGGLVLRSACHYGLQHRAAWVERISRVFYLGTPHDGANLEKVACASATALTAVTNPITKLVGDVLNLRSRGIKDLRYGTLLAPDVIDEGSDDPAHHQRRAVPWLSHAQHYLIAGTLTADPNHAVSLLLGDGLVLQPRRELWAEGVGGPIPEANVRVLPGVRHLQLAHDRAVYAQIKAWCSPGG